MTYGVQDLVPAPPLRPPLNGLLNSAAVIDTDPAGQPVDANGQPRTDIEPVRWLNGLVFPPEICPTIEIWAPGCQVGATLAAGGTHGTKVAYDPFTVIARDECSTYGWEAADYVGRATRALSVVETIAVEHEFWTGAKVATNAHLANSDATSLAAGAAYGIRAGLAALTRAIADASIGQGMIHAPVDLVELWWGSQLLYREGGRLYTANGNIVVPGSGYIGSSPAGAVPTDATTWAYATDLIQVLRGPVEVFPATLAQATDKVHNLVDFRAERSFAIEWNGCLHAAAHIDPTVDPNTYVLAY